MRTIEELSVTDRNQWRRWLAENHDARKAVWLIHYKKHTGKPRIPYDDAVEEALCFGWIDSIVKKVDEDKFAQKFTPRKKRSRWSELNKKRARKMMRKRKMTEAGLAKVREAKKNGEWHRTTSPREELVVPPYLMKALAKNRRALDNFNGLANSYKRQYVGWITSAKREETRKRRLEETIRLLERNEKLGMK